MIRVLIPDMPTADDLLPYLRQIDESKVYVNHGPLVQELEARLAHICGVPVVAVSSGTAALELVFKYFEPIYGNADIPALTFSATGLAARNAGMSVSLRDIGVDLQMHPDDRSGIRSVMVPVATFGRPVNVDEWRDFETPVVIDAAGALHAQKCIGDANIVFCFSLHATKFTGCGEGGFVASGNAQLLDHIRSMSEFGLGGTNAKMSEYHAAVGIASLGLVDEKAIKTHQLNSWYEDLGDGIQFYDNGRFYNTIKVAILPQGVSAHFVGDYMLSKRIETRKWYRPWLDERRDFFCRLPFPITEVCRDRLLGLPFHTQLVRQDVAWIMKSLKEAIDVC